jgi:hypothetical protein
MAVLTIFLDQWFSMPKSSLAIFTISSQSAAPGFSATIKPLSSTA